MDKEKKLSVEEQLKEIEQSRCDILRASGKRTGGTQNTAHEELSKTFEEFIEQEKY